MPAIKRPRRGSKAFYPKKRARRIYPRIKTYPEIKEAKPLSFAGYKAGMSHAMMIDTNPHSMTKGQQISRSVTILECPAISVFGFRLYKSGDDKKKLLEIINGWFAYAMWGNTYKFRKRISYLISGNYEI